VDESGCVWVASELVLVFHFKLNLGLVSSLV